VFLFSEATALHSPFASFGQIAMPISSGVSVCRKAGTYPDHGHQAPEHRPATPMPIEAWRFRRLSVGHQWTLPCRFRSKRRIYTSP